MVWFVLCEPGIYGIKGWALIGCWLFSGVAVVEGVDGFALVCCLNR